MPGKQGEISITACQSSIGRSVHQVLKLIRGDFRIYLFRAVRWGERRRPALESSLGGAGCPPPLAPYSVLGGLPSRGLLPVTCVPDTTPHPMEPLTAPFYPNAFPSLNCLASSRWPSGHHLLEAFSDTSLHPIPPSFSPSDASLFPFVP